MNVRKKEAYERLFSEVRGILNDHDPMGLVAMGAPEDEYEPEVGTILPKLSNAQGPHDVETIIAAEFLRWFDAAFPSGTLSAVAADVWEAYRRFRESVESA